MSVRMSQAFAAFRTSLVGSLTNELETRFLPEYNACIFDIAKEYDDNVKATEGMPENAIKKLVELAGMMKHSRILDLAVKRKQFIDGLVLDLKVQQAEKLKEYDAVSEEIEEERDGKSRKVTQAQFPDGSRAKVVQQLWINFANFQRV